MNSDSSKKDAEEKPETNLDSRKAAFIYTEEFAKYPYPAEHPFNTVRAEKTRELIYSMGLLSAENSKEVAPKAATRVELKKYHSARYLHALKTASEGKWDIEALNMGIGSADCPVFKEMYNYSALACGASLKGAELIIAGEADIAFNPSGGFHHAFPGKAAGFCYLNDVVLACLKLTENGKRVLYVDVDVHHGDGVADAFYQRDDVLTISFHENPRVLFPGTGFEDEIGSGDGQGYCVNVPLPAGTYDQAYMHAFNSIAVPLLKSYEPDVIVFELGADALAGDPLAHLAITNNTYADIIDILMDSNKPILATGGGGYNIENTVRAWTLAWSLFSNKADAYENIGLGGVMLESTDWQGGLRDRTLAVTKQQKKSVEPVIEATIEKIKKTIFPIHNI